MAPRFRFGLERVRELREHAEEQAKEQFASSLSQRAHGVALLRAAEGRLESARGECATGPVSGADLLSRQAFIERLERSRRDAVIDLQERERRLAGDRAALARASQEREVLDQLKARQRAAHLRDLARAESAQLDDLAIQAHIRRRAA